MIKIKIGRIKKYRSFRKGSILALVVIALIILAILGLGILDVAFGVRRQAIVLKNETSAMLAAEAGYERAVFWMEQQPNVLSSLAAAGGTATGSNTFTSSNSSYDYTIRRNNIGSGESRVVYRIVSNGRCGTSNRTIRVLVMQAVTGWDMGMCRIPSGPSSTSPVSFATGEIIDIPIHINKYNDSPDVRDIYISGTPRFLQGVEMGESQGSKYTGVMGLFEGGISFDQPDSKITDESVITAKVNRFASTALPAYNLTPAPPSSVTSKVNKSAPAVQLEFFVDNAGVGKVRITNNCVVQGDTAGTYDYEIKPGTNGAQYQKYNVYGCHYIPTGQARTVVNLSDTYVTPSYGGPSFGLIYVNGNVVIGSAGENAAALGVPANQLNTVQGNISIVATGNIWIANSLTVAGNHNATDGMPADDNPNMVSMLSDTQGVIKVIDPGRQGAIAPTNILQGGNTIAKYEPTGIKDSGQPDYSYNRHLSAVPVSGGDAQVVVEAGITVGGGGWGAEYVGNYKELSPPQDKLIVRGTITERVRGVVGLVGSDGFLKYYYFDERLLEGFIPEDMKLKGKYIPVPAGWEDYRPNN